MRSGKSQRRLRIFHGPHNIGGIGRLMADYDRKHGAVSDFIVYFDNTNWQNSHLNLHLEQAGFFARYLSMLATFFQCLFRYDLFHFYCGKTLLPFGLDLPFLKLSRKKMVMTYVGSDVRLYEVEAARNPYHNRFNTKNHDPKKDRAKKRMMRWQGLWVDRVIAVRNLYAPVRRCIPERKIVRDIWVTNTINPAEFTPVYEAHEVPVLVHAPSNPGLKGSDHVESAVEALQQRGYCFEYKRVQHTPHDQAVKIFQNADIIIDQLYLGGFGNLAMEGMAYGKTVCCYILDEIRRDLPDLPLVQCTVETLPDRLAWLMEHPEERLRLGKEGRAFVEKHCDREKTAQKLWQLYQEILAR